MAEKQNPQSAKTKIVRFLAIYFGVYIAVALILNATLGPPGMSNEYLESYKADHDRYVAITKDPAFKRYQQRPNLNPPDEKMAQAITFYKSYIVNPEFQAEQKRRSRYNLSFDFFKFGMVILLMVHFGRVPITGLLDNMAKSVRTTIARAENARTAAESRRNDADRKVAGLTQEAVAVQQDTDARIAEMRGENEAMTDQSLKILAQETEDRKHNEEALALKALKAELVDEAIALLTKRFQAGISPEEESELTDQFIDQMERQS